MTYNPRWVLNGLDLTAYPYSVIQDSADPGTAETVSAILASMIVDGDIELTQRRGNRAYELPVMIEGVDRAGIATAQADLVRAAEQSLGTLEFDPGDGSGVTVFETFAGTVSLANGTDDAAAGAGLQRLTVMMPCRPFVRPAAQTGIDAPPQPPSGTPPTDVTVDSGSATTGWAPGGAIYGSADEATIGANVSPFTGMVYVSANHEAEPSIDGIAGHYDQPVAHTPLGWLTRSATISYDATRPNLIITGRSRYRTGSYSGPRSGQIQIIGGYHSYSFWYDLVRTGWKYDAQLIFQNAAGAAIVPTSVTSTDGTGGFRATFAMTADIVGLTVKGQKTGSAAGYYDMQVGIDSIVKTAGQVSGIFSGKVQSRQVEIFGSQRTELSLAVLGLDASDAPVTLGDQTLIHTASAGSDGRAKFLGCRALSGLAGTSDPDAVTAVKTTVSTTASPTVFVFPATTPLPGEYVAYARIKAGSAATRTISYAAALDGTGALDASDPATGWYTKPVSVTTAYQIVPLGSLVLPPADIEDEAATLSIKVASDAAVDLDEVWLAHVESGQVTLLDTSGGGISAVRLDAATVDVPNPSAWVGVATATGAGAVMAAGVRIQAFDQHMAEPGLLQISTVTPGCATTRVSARYYRRYAHDVAPAPEAS
ncbi:MAG: hypothetical protein HOQ45_11945 [Nocardioidaceae bacterium]|nr:hypothetical protein [Nocardioidaceae bacterium]